MERRPSTRRGLLAERVIVWRASVHQPDASASPLRIPAGSAQKGNAHVHDLSTSQVGSLFGYSALPTST